MKLIWEILKAILKFLVNRKSKEQIQSIQNITKDFKQSEKESKIELKETNKEKDKVLLRLDEIAELKNAEVRRQRLAGLID